MRRFATLFICEYFSTLDFPSSGRRLGPGRPGQVPTGYKGIWPWESYISKRSIDGTGSIKQSDSPPTEMSASQKIASHVRKVSQLSSALGVSNVRKVKEEQNFQILHTAVVGKEVEGIGHHRKKEVMAGWECSPLPAKRWEQGMDLKGVSLSVVEESKKIN